MKKLLSLWIVLASLSLTACGGGSETTVHVVDYTPELRRFDVVDSYGIDTAEPGTTPLAINPYLYNGLFDVYWKVNSLEDYQVNIRINDMPSPNNSFLIYSEICGQGRACDQAGGLICEYTAELELSCNNSTHPTDIGDLFNEVPQRLYLILQVCDMNSSYCDFESYPVFME